MNQSTTSYYQQSRKDVLNLIPNDANRLLELGCGFGHLGREIKTRQNCELHGIELNENSASFLEKVYDKFWISDIESFPFSELNIDYDCIIFPDVLEHLADPWSVLKESVQHLSLKGNVIASIPNVRNFAIIYRLIFRGSWQYENHGILDKTHLRFFTRSTILEMFENAGLEIEEIRVNKDQHTGIKGVLSKIAEFFVKDINVCQYLVKAKVKNV